MHRIEKDFKDLDLATVDFSTSAWSWGCGGHPLAHDEWFVSFTSEDMVETRYKLPRFLCEMLVLMKEQGRKSVQGELQRAMGLY